MRTKTNAKQNEAGISVKLILPLILCALFCLAIASAQSSGEATMKGFRAHLEYFPPPHELQVKSDLEGAEAEPHGEGLILVRDAKLQTFQEDGAPEMTITTPQCFFNMTNQTVNSASPFQMRTADDGFLQKGVGFLWEKTNSEFIISNRVDTMVKGRMTNSFVP